MITGTLDLDANTVSGIVDAPHFYGSELQVQCAIWEPGGTNLNTTAQAEEGSYSCDFDDAGWDLDTNQTVAVYYFELDGDAVAYTFRQYGIFLPVIRR